MRDLAVLVLLGLACFLSAAGLSPRLSPGAATEVRDAERCYEAWDDQREMQPHLDCRASTSGEATSPNPRRSQGRH